MIIKIGLVDDHEMFMEGLSFILNELEDMEVCFSLKHGKTLLEEIKKHQPHILLLDINLDGEEGIYLAKLVLEKQEAQSKIIMLTMHKSRAEVKESYLAGASGFLPKNLDVEQLIQAIRDVHNGKLVFLNEYFPEILQTYGEERKKMKEEVKSKEPQFTAQELRLIRMMSEGLTSQVMAKRLCISVNTVRSYRKEIYKKAGAHSVTELLNIARHHKLI